MQVLPSGSIAALQESCGGDHPHPNSHEDEDVICPGKGRGTVVVESSEKLQKMLGFGGGFTDSATINFFKLPSEVQDKVCVCVCVFMCLCLSVCLSLSLSLSKRVCVGVFIKLHTTAQSGPVIYSFYATARNPPGGYLS